MLQSDLKLIRESKTLEINEQTKRLKSENRTVYKFGFGESPFSPPKILTDALQHYVMRSEYSETAGLLVLRKAISDHHNSLYGTRIIPENVVVGPGSKIILFCLLASFVKSDVLLARPSWVSYLQQIEMNNHNPIFIDTSFEGRWRITEDAIMNASKTKKYRNTVIIINYPGNPDGLTYTELELKEIARAARKLDAIVISDEIYGHLTFRGDHRSFMHYYGEGTIVTGGISKWCGAGGWRLGYAIIPASLKNLRETFVGVASETYSCASVPIQLAAAVAFSNFQQLQDYIKRQCNILSKLGKYCYKELVKIGVKVHKPEGAFYLLLDFTNFKDAVYELGITESDQLSEAILNQTGVAILSGTAFGMRAEDLSARLSFVDFTDLEQSHDFNLEYDFPRIVSGINALTNWLKSL